MSRCAGRRDLDWVPRDDPAAIDAIRIAFSREPIDRGVMSDVSANRDARHLDRFTSGVIAWFTARMVRSVMCVADGHDADGLRWFGRCDVDVDDDECPACLSRDRDERLDLADDATCADGWHDEPSASPHVLTDVWFVEGDAAEFVPFVIALAERWLR